MKGRILCPLDVVQEDVWWWAWLKAYSTSSFGAWKNRRVCQTVTMWQDVADGFATGW